MMKYMKFMIVTTIAALGFFSAVGTAYAQTDANCYDSNNVGSVGLTGWTGCVGMYITDSGTLKAAADEGQDSGVYQIPFGDTNYTFGDDTNNIFTGQVTTMRILFTDNGNFNEDIGYWDTSNVTNMGYIFNNANTFNHDISTWDTSSVTMMAGMFDGARVFNQKIGGWDVSSATDMSFVFRSAAAFNEPIGSWVTSNVTNMTDMFNGATAFNQAIGDWDVGSVTNMYYMFRSATNFDQSIGDWDVSSVTNMKDMFYQAAAFNQAIGDWDVSSVTNMDNMLRSIPLFNQDLTTWNVPQFTSAPSGFSNGSALATANMPNWGTGIVVANFDGTLAEGTSSTFTVELSSVPTEDVIIDLTSSDTGEGVLSPAQITFSVGTPANTAQTVTLTSQTDGVTDGDQSYTVTVAVSTSTVSDSDYANKAPQILSAVTTDVDIPGFTLSPSAITLAEGATATFEVKLDTAITDTVVLDLSSSDPGEGTLSLARLTFNASNNNARTVTVTAPTDTVIDGNKTYSITAAVNTALTTEAVYDAVADETLSATTTDTTNATLIFSNDVINAEEGATSSVTVSTGSVTSESEITIAYGAASGGTAEPGDYTSASSVTIPVGATSTTIEYFFIDDGLVEIAETVVVQITSAETTVEGVTKTLNLPTSNNATLTAANINTAVVSVEATTHLFETGPQGGPQSGSVTFTQSAMSSHNTTVSYTTTQGSTADLNFDYVDNEAGSVTISAGSLTATALFSASDDPADEGEEAIIVTLISVNNDGTAVGGGDAITVDTANNAATLTITDDDRPGVTVGTSSVEVAENGATGEFTVRLDSSPTQDVTFTLTTSGAATTTDDTLIFTTSNWYTLQTVIVSGADNNIADGTRSDTVILTASTVDTNYSGTTTSVTVSVADDEVAGVTVTTSPLDLNEGSTGTFTVVLNNQPVDDVTIGVSSSDTAQVTTSEPDLVFAPSNWDTPQTVTVSAVNNAVVDGGRPAKVILATTTTAGASSAYNGVAVPDVDVNITDDDVAGVTVASTSVSVAEGESAGAFTAVLTAEPTADVEYAFGFGAGSEETATTTVASITFTSANWNTVQTVSVNAVDNNIDAADTNPTITLTGSSSDTSYDSTTSSVTITVTDNDTAGLDLGATTSIVTEGGTSNVALKLNSEPTSDVTFTFSSEAQVSTTPSSLIFTSSNWNAFQYVTFIGTDDSIDDGNLTETVIFTAASTDSNYNSTTTSVAVTVIDDDTANVIVSENSISVTEGAASSTFTVVLATEPTESVIVNVVAGSADTTLSTSPLTFTTSNWNTAQTVSVSTVDDTTAKVDSTDTITLNSTSVDTNYNSASSSVTVSVRDNDFPGVAVSTSSVAVAENGATGEFTVKLNTSPEADVTFALTTSGAATTTDDTLIFTTSNWNMPQTVTVSGADNNIADGTRSDTVILTASTVDTNYNGATTSVTVSVADDEVGSVTVTTTPLNLNEGSTGTFTVVLDVKPVDDVTIGVSSSDTAQVTTSVASLLFAPSNWDTAQTVTVSAVNNAVVDGSRPAKVVLATTTAGVSSAYNGVAVSDVDVNITDDDTAGVTVASTSVSVTEGGSAGTFTVVLTSQPTADVVYAFETGSEATTTVSSIRFTSANWNTAQTVSVNAVDNNIIDGSKSDTVTLTVTTTDTNYASTTASSVAVTIADDDVGGVTAPASVSVTEGAAANYTVALAAVPTADVTVMLSTSTQLSISPASMTFTSANWNTVQTVTVTTTVDNSIKDGARSVTTTLTATSSDSNFNATSSNVTVTINDDGDTASKISAASSTGAIGTGTAGNMVTVTYLNKDGVTQTATTTVANDGTWSMSFVPVASNGSALTIMDTDTAANVSTTASTSSKVVDATPPTLTVDSDNSTTKLVKGTGDAGETIVVSYTDKGGNAATATTTVAADGTWSITLDPAAKSNTAVTVTSTDANGNTATVTIASIASADIDAVEIQQDIEEVMAASGEMIIATVPSVGGFISAGSTGILSAPTSAGETRANIKASDGSFAANLVTEGLRLSLNTTDSKTSTHIHTNDFKLGYDKGVGTLKASFTTQQMHVEIDETAAKTKLKFDGRLTPTRTKADRAGTINGWVSGELLRSEGSGNKMDMFVGRVGAHKFHDTDSLTGLMLTTDSGTGTFAADGFTTDNIVKVRSYMIGVYHGQKMQTAAGNSYNIEGQLHFGTSKMNLTTPAGDTGSTNGSRILATGRMSSDTTLGGYKLSPFIQGNYFSQKNDGFTTAQNNTVVAATKVSFADVALGTKFNYAQANGMTIGFEPSLVYRAKASGTGLNIDERSIRGRVSMDLDMPLQSAGGRLTTNVFLDGIGIASSRTYGASIKFERQF